MKLKNIKPKTSKTDIKLFQHSVYQVHFKAKYRPQGYSKHDIERLYKAFQKKYPENKRDKKIVQISCKFNNRDPAWSKARSWSFLSDSPSIPDFYEDDVVEDVIFYISTYIKPQPKGGSDINNDCLFNCILNALGNEYSRFPKDMCYPNTFKKKLKLGRDDKVPLSLIPIIEKKLNIKINVIGDDNYTSDYDSRLEINLKLVNEHYELIPRVNKDFNKVIVSKDPKKLIVYNDKNEYYDGKKVSLIKTDSKDFVFVKTPVDKTMMEYWNIIITEKKELYELSEGRIDLSRTNYNYKKAVTRLLKDSTRIIPEIQEMDPVEQNWIYKTKLGALIFAEETVVESAYNYDINSFYPSILNDNNFRFPIKSPSFGILNELPKILSYGCYRCEVVRTNIEKIDRLFRFNKLNYYTHIDLNHARNLNLEIKLINDGSSNVMLYLDGKDRIKSKTIFGSVIEYLFERKKQHPGFKTLLNLIWGSLAEKNKIYKKTTEGKFNIETLDCNIMQMNKKKHHEVAYIPDDKKYKLAWGRIEPFILSFARKRIAQDILPYNDHVKRLHTDGFVSNIDLSDKLCIGSGIGEYKLDKKGKCKILDCNTVIWEKL